MIAQAFSMLWSLAHYWSYANTIETAVLLVIVYDVGWHRWNAIKEIERNEQTEARTIQREEASEKRQIRRERETFIRNHWQELQVNLIRLIRIAKDLKQQRRFVQDSNRSQDDPTTKFLLGILANRFPELLAEFDDRWAHVVAQLNVFPAPRDLLALEIEEMVEELGKSVKDKHTEVRDETLLALAKLIPRVADAGKLLNLDD